MNFVGVRNPPLLTKITTYLGLFSTLLPSLYLCRTVSDISAGEGEYGKGGEVGVPQVMFTYALPSRVVPSEDVHKLIKKPAW